MQGYWHYEGVTGPLFLQTGHCVIYKDPGILPTDGLISRSSPARACGFFLQNGTCELSS